MRNDLLIIEYGEPGEHVRMEAGQVGFVPQMMASALSKLALYFFTGDENDHYYFRHFLIKAEEGSLVAFFETVVANDNYKLIKDLSDTAANVGTAVTMMLSAFILAGDRLGFLAPREPVSEAKKSEIEQYVPADAVASYHLYSAFQEMSQAASNSSIPAFTIIVPDMPPCRFVVGGSSTARAVGGLAGGETSIPLGKFEGTLRLTGEQIIVRGKSGHGYPLYLGTIDAAGGSETVAVKWGSRRPLPQSGNAVTVLASVRDIGDEQAEGLEPVSGIWKGLRVIVDVQAQVVAE